MSHPYEKQRTRLFEHKICKSKWDFYCFHEDDDSIQLVIELEKTRFVISCEKHQVGNTDDVMLNIDGQVNCKLVPS